MRMSSSIYDNLRQPGIFEELKLKTGGDTIEMRQALLARLRLDDLLTNDSLGEESRLVWSITDTLDGRLFTLAPPAKLKGIAFEIICHPSIAAAEPRNVVPMVLRSWIHNEDGKGRTGGFLALGEELFGKSAQKIGKMSGLNVKTLKDARDVAQRTDVIPLIELEKLVEL